MPAVFRGYIAAAVAVSALIMMANPSISLTTSCLVVPSLANSFQSTISLFGTMTPISFGRRQPQYYHLQPNSYLSCSRSNTLSKNMKHYHNPQLTLKMSSEHNIEEKNNNDTTQKNDIDVENNAIHTTTESTPNKENEKEENEAYFSTLRSIGVDFGLVRTGIAISTGGYQPRPLAILSNLNATQLSSKIVNYVISEQATNIVLGLPLHKNGTASEQSNITLEFGNILLQEVRKTCGKNVRVTLWDERYTSKEAASRIAAEAMARNKRIPTASDLEGQLDGDAACIILEHYYNDFGKDAEEMVLGSEELEEECERIYREYLVRLERERQEAMELRERGRNARREMIERAKALEADQGVAVGGGKKKKKKKKKK